MLYVGVQPMQIQPKLSLGCCGRGMGIDIWLPKPQKGVFASLMGLVSVCRVADIYILASMRLYIKTTAWDPKIGPYTQTVFIYSSSKHEKHTMTTYFEISATIYAITLV